MTPDDLYEYLGDEVQRDLLDWSQKARNYLARYGQPAGEKGGEV